MLALQEILRRLRRQRGYTVVAILSLALALAAATTVFAMVNGLLLRPLAVRAPAELISLYRQREAQLWLSLSYGEYRDVVEGARSFSGLTAFTVPGVQASLRVPGGAAQAVPIALVSGNYFEVLGLHALRGRFFDAAQDVQGGGVFPVVISEALWRARFAAADDIVGRAVVVNGQAGEVVGVMPSSFTGTFTALRTDVWLPLSYQPLVLAGPESLMRRAARFLNVLGRLRPGVTVEGARAELTALAGQLAQVHPESDEGLGFTLTDATGVPPFIERFIAPFLALMFGVVAVILLVACVNLAGLSLAQAAARRSDLALCMALGASRRRLGLYSLLEALLVSAAATVLGIALTRLATWALLRVVPDLGLPVRFDLRFDVRVFTFALAALVSVTVLFGTAPAWVVGKVAPMIALREAASSGPARSRLRSALLVVQIALSVVLLSGSVLLLRGLRSAARIDIGFQPSGVALLSFEPGVLGYDSVRSAQLYGRLLTRVSALPGVESAALAMMTPLGPRGDQLPVRASGRTEAQRIGYNGLTPGFFQVLHIPLLRGRDFGVQDTHASPGVAIVSAAMARRYWPEGDALGQHITIRGHDFEVVGVASDIKHGSVGEGEQPFLYLPLVQIARVRQAQVDAVMHVRSRSAPAQLLPQLPRELAALDPDIPASAALMNSTIQITLFPARLAARIVGTCGLLALLLTIVGLHALASFQAARRVREFAIRSALGARASDLARLVVGGSVRLTGMGLLIGLPAALAAGSLLRSLLFGMPATDAFTYALVAVALVAAVLLAGWAPARRAMRMDTVSALK